MADIVTGTTTGQLDTTGLQQDHADIRTEGFSQTADIRRDVLQSGADGRYAGAIAASDIRRDVVGVAADGRYANAVHSGDARREVAKEASDSRVLTAKEASDSRTLTAQSAFNVNDRVGTEADRVVDQNTQYFIAQQAHSFTSASALAALTAATNAGFAQTASDARMTAQMAVAAAQLEGAKNAAAAALGQAQIGQQIVQDGNVTRALINDLKYNDLNRALIERNAELVDERHYGRWAHRGWDQAQMGGQFAAVQNQLQAFGSQLQEVRQGTVNFGTMSGNAGRNTSTNNVV